MHATEFLAEKKKRDPLPVIVLMGEERFLKVESLNLLPGCNPNDEDYSLSRLPGATTELQDVMEELRTRSMFGDQRIVLIEDADSFVTEHRTALEKYVAKPSKSSVLILDVRTFQKTTKLYKAIDQIGLIIECTELKGATLVKWVQETARTGFQKAIDREAAALTIQLAGDSLGLLYQEISKLAAYVGDLPTITISDVEKIVGGWRLETTWVMLDAIRDGKPGRAIECLNKLIQSGDHPVKVLGGTTFSFRKLAIATEAARTGVPLPDALQRAGVFAIAVQPSEAYLRRIGFERASRILQLLLEADHDLKGGSKLDGKVILERLFLRLSGTVP
ncbi:MAG: DNA polymerase III subunit delta [Planctomyces sp.]|nr:DNA polymerase III subunit delta [Planctomyces sp.]